MGGRAVYFDLEGPLSPQDNAYEVLSLGANGRKVFEVISRYDDVLTIQGREDYEPGDTLKLIVPFLLYYNISEKDIEAVSSRAKVTDGAKEVIENLKTANWQVRIISTSYQQHAYNIGRRLGVNPQDIACTALPLSEYSMLLGEEELSLLEEMERRIIKDFDRLDEKERTRILDEFFFNDIKKTRLGRVFEEVRVVGGSRKVEALLDFSRRDNCEVQESVAVGDSITDYKMLKEVRDRGGLAIAFNGNEYCIPYADVAVASTTLSAILPLIDAFLKSGKKEVREKARLIGEDNSGIAWVEDADIEELVKVHGKYRKLVRGEAGKLG